MKILFLAQIVPYPPNAGPRIKTWNVLRYLARMGHTITLVCFVRRDEERNVPFLSDVCDHVHTVPMKRSRWADIGYWLRSQISRRPFLVERDDLVPMRVLVQRLMESEHFDCVHADQLSMAQFALSDGNRIHLHSDDKVNNGVVTPVPFRIFDDHNAVWTVVDRMRATAPGIIKPILALEAHRTKHYEAMLVRRFDRTLTVSEFDRRILSQTAAECAGDGKSSLEDKIAVVPISFDIQVQPVQRKRGSKNILTLGTLRYPPNAEGILWFAQEVFPIVRQRIPGTTLTIVGGNPPKQIQQLASSDPERIRVTGYVPDLKPFLESAGLMAVPVRAGSGMRVRILESFTVGVPVVTTTIGLEGIDARPGEDVLVADTAETYADAVISLLADESLQARLVANSRKLVEERYDLDHALQPLGEIYGSIGNHQSK